MTAHPQNTKQSLHLKRLRYGWSILHTYKELRWSLQNVKNLPQYSRTKENENITNKAATKAISEEAVKTAADLSSYLTVRDVNGRGVSTAYLTLHIVRINPAILGRGIQHNGLT